MVPIDVPDHWSSGNMRPGDSFGKSSDVSAPYPNLRWYSSIFSAPSFWPNMIVPMFDELARMSVSDIVSVGCGSWSLNIPSATFRWSGTTIVESAFTTPSSSADAIVMTLLADPGSNAAVTALLLVLATG